MKTILVTGDPTCDHNFYKGRRDSADDTPDIPGFVYSCDGGGVYLLRNILAAAVGGIAGCSEPAPWRVLCGLDEDHEKLPWKYHTLCLWEQGESGQDEAGHEIEHWHAQEPPLGYGDTRRPPHSSRVGDLRADAYRPNPCAEGVEPDLIVIDDAAVGFRDGEREALWPRSVDGRKPLVVVKLTGRLGENALWDHLVEHFADQLLAVVSSDALRRSDVRLSYGLSWEAVAEDIMAELTNNPILSPFGKARHLIVNVRSDAAFWLNNQPGNPSASIVFDPARAENEWSEGLGKAGCFGYLSCFTASIVRALCEVGDQGDDTDEFPNTITNALMAGLAASRLLRVHGHVAPAGVGKGAESGQGEPSIPVLPSFPFAEIAGCMGKRPKGFAVSPVPLEGLGRDAWMMLGDWQIKAACGKEPPRPHYDAAFAVAMHGVGAIRQFPYAKFGKYVAVDRHEIESLRTFRLLVRNYLSAPKNKKPLSLGVFGPPGSGKSFVVEEIAEEVLPHGKDDVLLFNLSQFSDPADLLGALHQVRDKVLSGSVPLVFWDEFDAENYKWLQYMLAPMEDGAFQDGQITHPIGRCIFVFAGATSYAYGKFGPLNPDDLKESERRELQGNHDKWKEIESAWRTFVLAKGPDFKSRLAGYLDLLGVNRRLVCTEQGGVREWVEDDADVCFPIRRALFIRSLMGAKGNEDLSMKPHLLRALLEIGKYRLGGRSLQFLCGHFRQSGQGCPGRACLPGHELLDMHVDAAAFCGMCERDMALEPKLRKLAPALHEGYRLRSGELDVPFDQLDQDMQRANVGQALRIPQVLRLAGMHLEPGSVVQFGGLVASRTSEDEAIRKTLEAPDTLEMLAEAEHNGWMVERMGAGQRYNPNRDKARKLHPCLVPYSRLSDKIKGYDRLTITGKPPEDGKPEQFGYVDIVKLVGLRIKRDEMPQ